jgi:SSS family solute:Na+ symporter
LVPAAVMSIGAANLFTRNFWKPYVNPDVTPQGEAKVAKVASLGVKLGALIFVLFIPTQFAINLQLLGGIWIVQTFPAVVFGLFVRWFRAPALIAGWATGIASGTWLVFADGIKPVHTLVLGHGSYTVYSGLLALALNILVAAIVQFALDNRASSVSPSHQS